MPIKSSYSTTVIYNGENCERWLRKDAICRMNRVIFGTNGRSKLYSLLSNVETRGMCKIYFLISSSDLLNNDGCLAKQRIIGMFFILFFLNLVVELRIAIKLLSWIYS